MEKGNHAVKEAERQLNNISNVSGKRARREPKVWYKLDLSAIVYPTLQRRDFSSVYRLSVVLKEEVKPDVLQQA